MSAIKATRMLVQLAKEFFGRHRRGETRSDDITIKIMEKNTHRPEMYR
jgi:hypothetical protein